MGNHSSARLVASCALVAVGCCFAPTPLPTPTPPLPPPTIAPDDLPVGAASPDLDTLLEVQIACASGPQTHACALASELAGAGAFDACPTTGMTTWLGLLYAADAGGAPERAVPFFLQVRAGSCDASARVLVAESPDEQADIDAAIAALRAGAPPPEGSGAVAYVRTAAPTHGYYALQPTAGVSTLLPSETQLYLRSAAGRALFVEIGAPLVDYPQAHVLAPRVIGELWRLP